MKKSLGILMGVLCLFAFSCADPSSDSSENSGNNGGVVEKGETTGKNDEKENGSKLDKEKARLISLDDIVSLQNDINLDSYTVYFSQGETVKLASSDDFIELKTKLPATSEIDDDYIYIYSADKNYSIPYNNKNKHLFGWKDKIVFNFVMNDEKTAEQKKEIDLSIIEIKAFSDTDNVSEVWEKWYSSSSKNPEIKLNLYKDNTYKLFYYKRIKKGTDSYLVITDAKKGKYSYQSDNISYKYKYTFTPEYDFSNSRYDFDSDTYTENLSSDTRIVWEKSLSPYKFTTTLVFRGDSYGLRLKDDSSVKSSDDVYLTKYKRL